MLANILIRERMQHGTDRTAPLHDEFRRIALARGAPFWVDLVGYHDGIAKMTQALETFAANSVEVEIPFHQATLAEVLIEADRLPEATALLSNAQARVERTSERWPLAEILRLQLTCAAKDSDVATAIRLLAEARHVCAEQAAQTWAERLEATAGKLGLAVPASPGGARHAVSLRGAAS